ncbi:toll/interleukin-1 receptor domain-containing protein [Alkalinema sp. FACHB-956]|uniref:toll/interleukin-1 receptor domain-containing protein n=1 Tax=Alkalinema sp. FACHB-956 TaxID=2692768 RepID=UPI001682425D|nr:toll/interleukin-1 receptor domain-containing protein [Alkalinema sp. FACHB-956]MBD2327767.1 toll/interleukin-1 receptor domain-containing protein [Alkalinema sp. FACHB-956]
MGQPSPSTPDPIPPTQWVSKNDVFISYSRRDKAFVEQLVAQFQALGRDPWIDWDDINKGEDWWKSIQRGIEAADSFVFIISPDSVLSSVCRDEIDHAAKHNKRFLPLLWREGFDMASVHRCISQHNWIFARATDNFQQAFQDLITALDTDLDYVRAHTRFLLRSIEWQHRNQDPSYLLRGTDLADAQTWLSQGISKQPRPTANHSAYITASLNAKTAALKARQKAKWIVVLTTVIANLLFVAAGLTLIYWRISTIAEQQVEQTMEETLDGALAGIDGDEFAQLSRLNLAPGQTEPSTHPLYQAHQDWLQTVHQIAPKAFPATYTRNADRKLILVGDLNRITDPSQASPYHSLITDNLSEMEKGLTDVVINLTPYKNEFGTWVSIYGPIKNQSGQVVGALCLTYDSTYWTNLTDKIKGMMTIAYILAFLWLIISSWLILRATQPTSQE